MSNSAEVLVEGGGRVNDDNAIPEWMRQLHREWSIRRKHEVVRIRPRVEKRDEDAERRNGSR
ncbi:MAG TPA: hypothetical protein VF698_06720 [Thermoanaerobaculia bacterium]|jgi:hypothetical protein